jgi:hypothetical protein
MTWPCCRGTDDRYHQASNGKLSHQGGRKFIVVMICRWSTATYPEHEIARKVIEENNQAESTHSAPEAGGRREQHAVHSLARAVALWQPTNLGFES